MAKAKTRTTKAKCTATLRGAQYEYTVSFEPAEEGGYVVSVLALPGLHTEGDTFEEACAMAQDAIRGYLECLREDGEQIPVEHGYLIAHRMSVSLAKA
ncbi:MAG TPA: type II toxin-antitoxin system HicB family antitoxin [Candidatus Binatia bacterium]|nr:type II toxin-antitoxin system HicB family antitoxin [Candidatus Binatia bacterium]